MFHGYQNKQRQLVIWSSALIVALFLLPVGARAAIIVAKITTDTGDLVCDNPREDIGGEDVRGTALILGLELSYEVPSAGGNVINNPVGFRKNLDGCTPLLLQALVQNEQVEVVVRIFEETAREGLQERTRITLQNARIVGVAAAAEGSDTDPTITTAQEVVRVLALQLLVEDLITGTSTQIDFGEGRP